MPGRRYGRGSGSRGWLSRSSNPARRVRLTLRAAHATRTGRQVRRERASQRSSLGIADGQHPQARHGPVAAERLYTKLHRGHSTLLDIDGGKPGGQGTYANANNPIRQIGRSALRVAI